MENRITVDFNALDRIVKKLNTASNDLQDAVSILAAAHPTQKNGGDLRIQGASTSLRSVGGTVQAYNVAQAVQNYRIAVARLSSHSHALAAGVRSVSSAFRGAENKAGRTAKAGNTGEAAPKTTGGNGERGRTGFDWSAFMPSHSDWMKLVAEGGIIGAEVSAIWSYLHDLKTGAVTGKSVISLLKGGAKVVERIAKGFSENSFDWIGLAKGNPKTFAEALGDQLDKYKPKTSGAENVAVAAKWVGSILTVATTAYDNFTDTTENNSTGRKIAETIGESAVKIGGGMLIGAGVAAVIGGAPAILVGGATVLVTWAIDSTFEAITGKGAAEFISDAVLDGASYLAKETKKAVDNAQKKLGKAIDTAGKKISGWWESLRRDSGMAYDGGGGYAW